MGDKKADKSKATEEDPTAGQAADAVEKPKLSKKQLKALEFKKKGKGKSSADTGADTNETKDEAKSSKKRKRDAASDVAADVAAEQPVEAKKSQKKYILFVGNLPYNVTEATIKEHFKACPPTAVRIRHEKGFAFLEFEGEDSIKNLNTALRMHHSELQYRKINVELTAGGGGNSKRRVRKLKEKNTALRQEQEERMKQEREEEEKKAAERAKKRKLATERDVAGEFGSGVHPARLKMLAAKGRKEGPYI